jgi:hypothetical protein
VVNRPGFRYPQIAVCLLYQAAHSLSWAVVQQSLYFGLKGRGKFKNWHCGLAPSGTVPIVSRARDSRFAYGGNLTLIGGSCREQAFTLIYSALRGGPDQFCLDTECSFGSLDHSGLRDGQQTQHLVV